MDKSIDEQVAEYRVKMAAQFKRGHDEMKSHTDPDADPAEAEAYYDLYEKLSGPMIDLLAVVFRERVTKALTGKGNSEIDRAKIIGSTIASLLMTLTISCTEDEAAMIYSIFETALRSAYGAEDSGITVIRDDEVVSRV